MISVGSDEEWAGLCRAMRQPELVDDRRFATLADRIEHHDELDELIGNWVAPLDRWQVTRRCQAERVPAGPVYDEADTYEDRHLQARGFFRRQGSEDVGEWDFPGHQWRWDGPDMRWDPICRLGADNEYVLRDVAGLSAEEYAALDAAGHLSLDYLQPDGSPY